MNRKAFLVAAVSVLSIVIGVGIAKATGYWRTESSKVPVRISDGEFSGSYDPGDIRGSYTFTDIEKSFGIPPAILADAFGMESPDPGELQAKSLEEAWAGLSDGVEVGTDSIRLFTALWTGLPHESESTTVLPVRAVRILLDEGKIDRIRGDELMADAVNPPGLTPEAVPAGTEGRAGEPAAAASNDVPAGETGTETHEVPDRQVRGLTTFGDLSGWGVTTEAWEGRFGVPMGARPVSLKDWAEETGRSMTDVKNTAQELVDAAL